MNERAQEMTNRTMNELVGKQSTIIVRSSAALVDVQNRILLDANSFTFISQEIFLKIQLISDGDHAASF